MALDGKVRVDRWDYTWLRLWAKTGQEGSYYPLLWHMFDVAAVANLLWDYHLTSSLRRRLACSLGPPDPRTQVAFAAGAHDIGKACQSFEREGNGVVRMLGTSISDGRLWSRGNRPEGTLADD